MTRGIEEVLAGHTDPVWSVAISHAGTRVVSSGDMTVRIWNAETGETKHILQGHLNGVRSVAFSRDETRVVSGSMDKSVRIWNAVTGEIERVLDGHDNGVLSVAFSPDETDVVSSGWDTVHIWDATINGTECTTQSFELGAVRCIFT